MRLFSWSSICIVSAVLCATCLADAADESRNSMVVDLVNRRRQTENAAPTFILDNPDAITSEEPTTRRSATATLRSTKSPKTSEVAKTSATSKKTPGISSQARSTRTVSSSTTPKPSPSTTTESSITESSSTSESTSSSTTESSTTSSSSSSSSTKAPQPTSILRPQPQSTSNVSVGGIVAGAVLGAAVSVGIIWIALAKWREKKRQRAGFTDEEGKKGFAGAGPDDQFSSRDSLLAGAAARPSQGTNNLRMQSLAPASRANSFVSSSHQPFASQITQDVLPPPSPASNQGLPDVSPTEPQTGSPLRNHPYIAEMPSPHGTPAPPVLQPGWSVPRKALSLASSSSPVGASRGPSGPLHGHAAELPG